MDSPFTAQAAILEIAQSRLALCTQLFKLALPHKPVCTGWKANLSALTKLSHIINQPCTGKIAHFARMMATNCAKSTILLRDLERTNWDFCGRTARQRKSRNKLKLKLRLKLKPNPTLDTENYQRGLPKSTTRLCPSNKALSTWACLDKLR